VSSGSAEKTYLQFRPIQKWNDYMKFVFFGYDFMLPSVIRLIEGGHELIGIMSFECDNVFNFNQSCQELAKAHKIPFILSHATDEHIEQFLSKGCEAFLSAGYPHKIPHIDENKAYAINIHPTHLPQARGMMPIPRIIMDNIHSAAGFTAHKMTQNFDGGDILRQIKFPLNKHETVETYTAKIAMRAPDMVADLFEFLPSYWKSASAQNPKKASHFKAPTDQDRVIDWSKPVKDIDATARAFGRFGSVALFDNRVWIVYSHAVWEEKHNHQPGLIVAGLSREIVIAAADGYVCLKEFQEAPQST
jgi:methionyl-tRNA formyltransferase